ncbi:MAG: DUF3990 domain-containing protein [Victivallales bacterium]|nr:DUF3990 domain-containing protein [Victivallales bacterium]
MLLYHGSNVEVIQPKILPSQRKLDFGQGFYLTSSISQASRWAKGVFDRRKSGNVIVSEFDFDAEGAMVLSTLVFPAPNASWLDFVVDNRKNIPQPTSYDLVIGPVANDTTLVVLDDYLDGKYSRDEAIARLLPQKLTDQYAFRTERSLDFLTFRQSRVIP